MPRNLHVLQATNDQILEVGHRVSKTLKAAGLSVVWAEDANDTIMIKVQHVPDMWEKLLKCGILL